MTVRYSKKQIGRGYIEKYYCNIVMFIIIWLHEYADPNITNRRIG